MQFTLRRWLAVCKAADSKAFVNFHENLVADENVGTSQQMKMLPTMRLLTLQTKNPATD